MSRTSKEAGNSTEFASNRALWRRCQTTDAPADEAARFLDLAAFAEGVLDEEERDRVAADLATDPVAAADVAAARVLGRGLGAPPAEIGHIIARADALVPEASSGAGLVRPFAAVPARHRLLQGLAQWGSLAA